MMVVVHATGEFPQMDFAAQEWEGARVFAVGALQDFSSRLYRDPDAIGVLHCHMPDMAAQIVRGMRDGNIESPLIVLLRERGTPEYRMWARAQTLIAGADDAQPDNLDPRELIARLRAIHARTRLPDELIVIPPAGRFDPSTQKVTAEGIVVQLTGKESALLELLAARPGVLMPKRLCMQALYDGRDEPKAKILDVFICKLRKKLQPICGTQQVIETSWGQGYRFVANEVVA